MTEVLRPVSETAYYCCGVRALDAAAAAPVCGDRLAERFMTPAAWALFEPFRELEAPNATNVARHRMIDDLLRAQIARRPDTGVVIIGAGFDTRAFRLPGAQWVELDEPPLIELKETRLPASEAPNPLTRVAIAFEHRLHRRRAGAVSASAGAGGRPEERCCRISQRQRCSASWRPSDAPSPLPPSSAT